MQIVVSDTALDDTSHDSHDVRPQKVQHNGRKKADVKRSKNAMDLLKNVSKTQWVSKDVLKTHEEPIYFTQTHARMQQVTYICSFTTLSQALNSSVFRKIVLDSLLQGRQCNEVSATMQQLRQHRGLHPNRTSGKKTF